MDDLEFSFSLAHESPSAPKPIGLPAKGPTNTTFFFDSDADDSDSEGGPAFSLPASVDSLPPRSAAPVQQQPQKQPPRSSPGKPAKDVYYRLKSVGNEEQAADGTLFRASLASSPDRNGRRSPERSRNSPRQTKVRSWSTQQVAAWMFNSGLERPVVSSFVAHHIDGATLLDLSREDLRDLEVGPSPRRAQLWDAMTALRSSSSAPDPLALVRKPEQLLGTTARLPARAYSPTNSASRSASIDSSSKSSKHKRSRSSGSRDLSSNLRRTASNGASAPKPLPPRSSSLQHLSKLDTSVGQSSSRRHAPSSSDPSGRRHPRDEKKEARRRSLSAPPPCDIAPLRRARKSRSPSQERPREQRARAGSTSEARPASASKTTAPALPTLPSVRFEEPANVVPAVPKRALRPSASDANLVVRARGAAPLPTLTERDSRAFDDSDADAIAAAASASMRPGPPTTSSARMPFPQRSHSQPRLNARSMTTAPPIAPASPSRVSPSPPPLPIKDPRRVATYATPTSAPSPAPGYALPPSTYGADVSRVGWLRRRRARLWRVEWAPVHARLAGGVLSLHGSDSPRDTSPLARFALGDYTLACTSPAGAGRLASAVRSFRGPGGAPSSSSVAAANAAAMATSPPSATSPNADSGLEDASFAFQLVPKSATAAAVAGVENCATSPSSASGSASSSSREDAGASSTAAARGGSGAKSAVVLAVGSTDERIEWMRQVMLAQAGRGCARAGSVSAASSSGGPTSAPVGMHGVTRTIIA